MHPLTYADAGLQLEHVLCVRWRSHLEQHDRVFAYTNCRPAARRSCRTWTRTRSTRSHAGRAARGHVHQFSNQHCSLVQANSTLEELHLDTNQIDDDGVEALAAVLAANTSLKKLNLSANRIGDAGVAALAEMLKVNSTLEELDLASNEVEYDGAPPPQRFAQLFTLTWPTS